MMARSRSDNLDDAEALARDEEELFLVGHRLRAAETALSGVAWRIAQRWSLDPHDVMLAAVGVGGATLASLIHGEQERAVTGAATPPASRRSGLYLSLVQRDGEVCQECGVDQDLQIDHIMPRALGGGDWLPNRQLLCGPCNLRKRDKHPNVWRAEIATRRAEVLA